MAIEDIQALEEMRSLTLEHRRKLVKAFTRDHASGSAQDLREVFLKVQTTLEAIGRALEDERAAG